MLSGGPRKFWRFRGWGRSFRRVRPWCRRDAGGRLAIFKRVDRPSIGLATAGCSSVGGAGPDRLGSHAQSFFQVFAQAHQLFVGTKRRVLLVVRLKWSLPMLVELPQLRHRFRGGKPCPSAINGFRASPFQFIQRRSDRAQISMQQLNECPTKYEIEPANGNQRYG